MRPSGRLVTAGAAQEPQLAPRRYPNDAEGTPAACVSAPKEACMPYLFWLVLPLVIMDTFTRALARADPENPRGAAE